jgi:hypothetical protein
LIARNQKFSCFFWGFIAIFMANAVYAQDNASLQESQRCMRYFSQYEQAYNMPSNLLKAVSIMETGVYHKPSARMLPWPWTVNSQGKGYYFKTKQEAIAAVRKLILRGVTSIDVGCMQINLHYHPDAFTSLDQAFDPQSNIAYGAKFLQSNYTRSRSWKKAVASYHSETPSRGLPYMQRVVGIWQKEYRQLHSLGGTPSYQLASASTQKSSIVSSSYSRKARRNSNMFIKVRQQPDSDSTKLAVVGDITQNVLRNYQANVVD